MCHLGCAIVTRYRLNNILDVSLRVFLVEINIYIGGL